MSKKNNSARYVLDGADGFSIDVIHQVKTLFQITFITVAML
jgi:hypothetical protein